jgi:hypothetical protein
MPMSDGQTAVLLAEPSVQSLFIQMQFNGQPLSTGTGFVVQSNKGPMLVTKSLPETDPLILLAF